VYVCWAERIPDAVLRHTIDARVTRSVHEHLLIFAQSDKSRQVWQWVAHEAGQPHFLRSFEWRKGQGGDVLAQRLAEIAIPINEEESIDLTLVTHRLKDAFDRDHVTKRFYERFAKQREQFQGSILGMSDDDAKWYTSVIVDRLMFIYFLQKQGFLANGDRDYLRGKLDFIQFKGPDQYYSDFLTTLFFEGFAKPTDQRSAETQRMLGDIPYLNGGLFAPHDLEMRYKGQIQIPDVAFDKLLTFFDQYQWTLDDRPLGHDNEINPDVLGYIFEKYVNQKQMGAYYTKEDITGYISQETIIPRLFDMVRAKYKPAFAGEHSVFTLLKDDPDTYIYASMRKGARDEKGDKMSLPDNIAQGLHDVAKRGDWNKPADAAYALPTEIWREVVARTQRYEEVRKHCTDGDIADINDLITYNLDIRQFAQDAIAQSEDPAFVLEFFKALTTITVLDPTVGSGAFLFAALNILARLYEVCLQRMEQFQQDGVTYTGQALKAVQQFDGILREADKHSNRRYYILKSIVVHNLYGVDIMEEAVEICKLRLFLRLVAELKPGQPVEPLPDIDFNIKAGNTLVGYAHLKDAVNAAKKQLFGEKTAVRIQQKAEDLARLYRKMQDQQMVLGGRVTSEDKRALQERRKQLVDELDEYLAYDYGIQTKKPGALQDWRAKTLPFHWFAEFYDILQAGGFDVVIGNPPYVEYSKVKSLYDINNYATETCGNLYGYVIERSRDVDQISGRFGMIVPVSVLASRRTAVIRSAVANSSIIWHSSYSNRPAKLFDGVEQRLTIILLSGRSNYPSVTYSGGYRHWYSLGRAALLGTLSYVRSDWRTSTTPPKVRDQMGVSTLVKLEHGSTKLDAWVATTRTSCAYFHNGPTYWVRALDHEPNVNHKSHRSNHYIALPVHDSEQVLALVAILNSSLFYFWFKLFTNCRDLMSSDIEQFPVGRLSPSEMTGMAEIGRAIAKEYDRSKAVKSRVYESGYVQYDEYYPVSAKTDIDRADCLLARHFALTDEELDYVVNYDIKYRLGADDGDEADDA
jgi:hypothetical protein